MAGEHEVSLRHGYRGDGAIKAVELTCARANLGEIRAVPFIAVSRAALFLVTAIAATALIGWVTAAGPHPLVVLAVAAGALVAGLAGFAFSPVAGALIMHWVAPLTIVPVLLACSITTQLFSIAKLRRTMEWRRMAPFLLGGFLGIPLGAALLRDVDPHRFVVAFGAFLMVYGVFMLLRPRLVISWRGPRDGRLADVVCGLIGGITGGSIAFPGAAPTIWCSLRGFTKDVQRGIVQPFILVMQIATISYFSHLGILTSSTISSYLVCVPAVLFGTWLGLRLFAHIDDAAFRRVVLIFLIVSGASLIL
jgi:uncharacterized membrane protein YfcA